MKTIIDLDEGYSERNVFEIGPYYSRPGEAVGVIFKDAARGMFSVTLTRQQALQIAFALNMYAELLS